MCDEWRQNMDDGNINWVMFLYTRKAFDSVIHDHDLLSKLHNYFGTSGLSEKLLQTYLEKKTTTMCCQWSNFITKTNTKFVVFRKAGY